MLSVFLIRGCALKQYLLPIQIAPNPDYSHTKFLASMLSFLHKKILELKLVNCVYVVQYFLSCTSPKKHTRCVCGRGIKLCLYELSVWLGVFQL